MGVALCIVVHALFPGLAQLLGAGRRTDRVGQARPRAQTLVIIEVGPHRRQVKDIRLLLLLTSILDCLRLDWSLLSVPLRIWLALVLVESLLWRFKYFARLLDPSLNVLVNRHQISGRYLFNLQFTASVHSGLVVQVPLLVLMV